MTRRLALLSTIMALVIGVSACASRTSGPVDITASDARASEYATNAISRHDAPDSPLFGPVVLVLPTAERYATDFLPPDNMRAANFLGGLPQSRNPNADEERAEVMAAMRATARGLRQLLDESGYFTSVRLVENDNPSTQVFGDAAIRIEVITTAAAWERRFRPTSMPSHFDEAYVTLRDGSRQRIANLRLNPNASVSDMYAAWVRAMPGLADQIERLAHN